MYNFVSVEKKWILLMVSPNNHIGLVCRCLVPETADLEPFVSLSQLRKKITIRGWSPLKIRRKNIQKGTTMTGKPVSKRTNF